MFEQNKPKWDTAKIKRLTDVRNIALYVFTIFVLAMTWSGIKTVQANYELQKRVAELRQENEILQLENDNTALQNLYLESDQYLELAARRNLGLAAPGETVMLVPKDVALKYVSPELAAKSTESENVSQQDKPKYKENLEDWRSFLLGRQVSAD